MTPLGEAVGSAVILTGVYSLSRGETTLVAVWVAFVVVITIVAWLWGGDD